MKSKITNHCTPPAHTGQGKFWAFALIGLGLLLTEGFSQRWLVQRIDGPDSRTVKLEKPLSTLPLRIGPWTGVEMPMDPRVLDVAGCDDHIYRRYINDTNSEGVSLYVAYAARPARMIGHRPQVCFPGNGWQPVDEHLDRLILPGGQSLDCRIHQFRKNEPQPLTIVVLNYYVLQGHVTTEWTDFWGLKWRMPNLAQNPNFYVAQVQITSEVRETLPAEAVQTLLKSFAADVADRINDLLPGAEKPK